MPRFRIDPGENSRFETPQSVSGSVARISMNHAVTGSGSEPQSRGAPRRRSRLGEWMGPASAPGRCAISGEVVGRPRRSTDVIQLRIDPKESEGFPSCRSGHTVHYTAFFGFLGFLALTRLKPAALSWPLLSMFGGLVFLVGPAR